MPAATLFRQLRDDMFQTRQRRFQYQLAKIAALGSLIGVATMLFEKRETHLFYYVIPFVAVAFDYYILGESFTLRRLAAFVRREESGSPNIERRWERFVKRNPDPLSSFANLIVTGASSIGCFLILTGAADSLEAWFRNGINSVWLLCVAAAVSSTRLLESQMKSRVWHFDDDDSPRG
jgi:hypothetical protein